jgi:hypothetical protein
VAAFCTKCGAALTPGTQFCTSCGAPAPVANPTTPPPAYGQPAYGQPVVVAAQPAPPTGTSAVKIILIVVGALVGLGIISLMFFVFFMSRVFHVNQRGNTVTVSTPGGTVTSGSGTNISDADLGVPIYPGAARREGGMTINGPNGSMVTVVYSTTDPVDKVVDFYKGKVGGNASVITTGTGAVISSSDQNKNGVIITIGADNSSSGGTKIAIMRTKSK